MRILITGGTGTIGRELAKQYMASDVVVFSRNELAQVEMKRSYGYDYVLGDVRDYNEVLRATVGLDYVFHMAALKHVDICEKQPMEAIKTNVVGTLNVINACIANGCKLVNMSSDKAINPANTYGMTKKLAEEMTTQAGFVSVRSGNVLWSSGSVLRIWEQQLIQKNEICLTHEEMTRFFIHPSELAVFILQNKDGRGVRTAPMVSFRLYDIASKFIGLYGNKNSKIKITGLRDGERLHEFRDENTSSENNISDNLDYIFNGSHASY